MALVNCAVVAYLPGRLGEFVDSLRKRLNPRFAHWLAHVTILPPRPLPAHTQEFLADIREKCQMTEPFDAGLSEVSTFWPIKGVVYLPIAAGAERLAALHNLLSGGASEWIEPYPYVPHVTVAQELDEAETQAAVRLASEEWARFSGAPSFRIESLSLVRQQDDQCWIDLASVALGSALKPAR
jgi:2'-5' RNA ligase